MNLAEVEPRRASPAAALARALTALPFDPDDVARRLVADGSRGYPCATRRCPLARWLTARVGTPVATNGITAWVVAWVGVPTAYLPTGARTFARRFDVGEYPELREEEP